MFRIGICQSSWQRARKELEVHGYLNVTRKREFGRFVWNYDLYDNPSNNPNFSTNGRFSANGDSVDGKQTDKLIHDLSDKYLIDTNSISSPKGDAAQSADIRAHKLLNPTTKSKLQTQSTTDHPLAAPATGADKAKKQKKNIPLRDEAELLNEIVKMEFFNEFITKTKPTPDWLQNKIYPDALAAARHGGLKEVERQLLTAMAHGYRTLYGNRKAP